MWGGCTVFRCSCAGRHDPCNSGCCHRLSAEAAAFCVPGPGNCRGTQFAAAKRAPDVSIWKSIPASRPSRALHAPSYRCGCPKIPNIDDSAVGAVQHSRPLHGWTFPVLTWRQLDPARLPRGSRPPALTGCPEIIRQSGLDCRGKFCYLNLYQPMREVRIGGEY